MLGFTRRSLLPLAVLAIVSLAFVAGPVTAGTSSQDDVATVRELGNVIAGVAERARHAVVFLAVEAKRRPSPAPSTQRPMSGRR